MCQDGKPCPHHLGGFFDGEGSIAIELRQGKMRMEKYGYGQHTLVCSVSNLSQPMLSNYLSNFGGHVYGPFIRYKDRLNQKPLYEWVVRGKAAGNFLMKLRPNLVLKATQADLGIEFEDKRIRSRRLPVDEILKREAFRQRMIKLNMHKGPRPPEFKLLKHGEHVS